MKNAFKVLETFCVECECGDAYDLEEQLFSYSNDQSFASHAEQAEWRIQFKVSDNDGKKQSHFILYFVEAYQDKALKLFKTRQSQFFSVGTRLLFRLF